MKVCIEDVFKNEKDYFGDEIIYLIRYEDFEKATEIEEDFLGNNGWYNEFRLKFNYQGKRYMIEYKEHTSDNVSDFSFTSDLILLGEAQEMKKEISKEDLAIKENLYQNKINKLEEELKKERMLNEKQREFYLLIKSSRHLEDFFKMAEESFSESSFNEMAQLLKEIRKVMNS